MRLVVLAKPVGDRRPVVDRHSRQIQTASAHTLGRLDHRALMHALSLAGAGDQIAVLCAGPPSAAGFAESLAGHPVHRVVLVTHPVLADADYYGLAKALAAALDRVGFDLILAGDCSPDDERGAVAQATAGLLDIPHLSGIERIERLAEDLPPEPEGTLPAAGPLGSAPTAGPSGSGAAAEPSGSVPGTEPSGPVAADQPSGAISAGELSGAAAAAEPAGPGSTARPPAAKRARLRVERRASGLRQQARLALPALLTVCDGPLHAAAHAAGHGGRRGHGGHESNGISALALAQLATAEARRSSPPSAQATVEQFDLAELGLSPNDLAERGQPASYAPWRRPSRRGGAEVLPDVDALIAKLRAGSLI